jgi:hypothetical protein
MSAAWAMGSKFKKNRLPKNNSRTIEKTLVCNKKEGQQTCLKPFTKK